MTLRDDLIRDEGYRRTVYNDTLGVATCGYGRNMRDVGLSEDEAAYLLDNDIRRVEADLDHAFPWWTTRPEHVQRGMANMCFQIGLHGLATFRRMLACLQAGDYQGAQEAGRDSLWERQTPARAERVLALFAETAPP